MVYLAMSDKREIVFLLGAGATVDAGLHTATDLTDIVEQTIAAKHPSLLPALRFIRGAIQFGKACQSQPLTDKINIEELVMACTLLASREESDVYPFVSAWHERITRLQRLPDDIQSNGTNDSFQLLANYCKQGLRNWLAIKDAALIKYLWSFRDFINEGYRLRIFSLNYDECIECALSDALGQVNKEWTTGFDEGGWNPKLLDSDNYEAYIYKLHGSLDWVRDPKFGICCVKWPPARDIEELPDDFESLLIFGTDIKLQAVDPFLTLLFRFQQLLNVSDILVVVGYSFGDTHVNAMILEALQRDPRMRCIITNTESLDKLLPHDSDFKNLLAVEQRFIEVRCSAKKAFESNELLAAVKSVFKDHEKELPF
jgi:hypothetical protein